MKRLSTLLQHIIIASMKRLSTLLQHIIIASKPLLLHLNAESLAEKQNIQIL